MNEIETIFYNALLDRYDDLMCEIETQQPIGIYKPDFMVDGVIVEIDGHDYHKTKEQREKDYKRERYFQKKGYEVVRFMGTEVYLDATACVCELLDIISVQVSKEIKVA